MSSSTAVADTRSRILDAASQLFSSIGVGATSVRAIIREAGVNLNAIHYHFGSKDRVTREVFRRVMAPIHRERHRLLNRAEAQGPNVRSLLHAVYWPLVRRGAASAKSQARRGLLIATQLRSDPSPSAAAILSENQSEFAPRFEALLEQASGLTEEHLRLTIRFINAAAWGIATQPVLLNEVVGRGNRSERVERLFEDFLDFACAGIERLQVTHGQAVPEDR